MVKKRIINHKLKPITIITYKERGILTMKKIMTSIIAVLTFTLLPFATVSADSVQHNVASLKSSLDAKIERVVTTYHENAIDRTALGHINRDTRHISINDPSVKTVQITMNANVDDLLAGQPVPNRPVSGQTRYLLAFDNHQDAVNGLNQIKQAYSSNNLIDVTQLHGIKQVTQLNQLVEGHKTIIINQQQMSMNNLVLTLRNMTNVQLSL